MTSSSVFGGSETSTGTLVYGAVVTLTDAATVVVDASRGKHFYLSTGSSRTIANPTNVTAGQELVFEINNGGAGAITTTWSANYKLAGGWTDPNVGKTRTIRFSARTTTALVETGRAESDITP